MPLNNLEEILKYYDNVHFVSYFTVDPTKDYIQKYIDDFQNLAQNYGYPKLWLLGRQVQFLNKTELPLNIQTFNSIQELVDNL